MATVEEARAYFPRGLAQPPASRFSVDALLLARFAAGFGPGRLLDLGTGCGVVALGMLLEAPGLTGAGLDIQPEAVAAAMANAERLGLSGRFAAHQVDLREARMAPLAPGSFDLATANPPYRVPGSGRPAAGEARNLARFEAGASLDDFCRAAAHFLKNRGRFAAVFPAGRLAALLAAMESARLAPKRVLPVHSRATEPARLVLAMAVKGGGPGLTLDPPLVLYEGSGGDTRLTPAALDFCPWLACNPRGARPRPEEACSSG